MITTYTNNNRVIVVTHGDYKYTVTSMVVVFKDYVRLEGTITYTAPNGKEYFEEDLRLTVDNTSYRNLSTLAVVDASTALNPNGSVKTGYIGELDLFVELFGHNTANQVNSMYPFIVDAIQRKYNLI